MASPVLRIIRVPIPVPLIREMDKVITEGVGGYATRTEFIVDAIQERILELTLGPGEDAGPPPATLTTPLLPEVRNTATPLDTESAEATLRSTALVVPEGRFSIGPDCNRSRPEGKRLFGLHNRDYPALWALAQLAGMTGNAPVPVEKFHTEVLREAWEFGRTLQGLERHLGRKCTALFPTNTTKRKAANQAFRLFAIGHFSLTTEGRVTTGGPLFEWRAAGLVGTDGDLRIGLTRRGWDLLAALEGLSVAEPHREDLAAVFLDYIAAHAPADHAGFAEIVQAVGEDGATRKTVCNEVAAVWPDWTSTQVETNVAGYVARAREWGLVEPKQRRAKYQLTQFGHKRLNLYREGRL